MGHMYLIHDNANCISSMSSSILFPKVASGKSEKT
jgi:hypothetical protein